MCVSACICVCLWASLCLHPRVALCICAYSCVSVCETTPSSLIHKPLVHRVLVGPWGREKQAVGSPTKGSCILKETQAALILFKVETPSSSQVLLLHGWPWISDKGPALRPRRWMRQRVQLSKAQSQRKLTGQLALPCWVPSGLGSSAS